MRATIPVQGNVNADVSADATPLVQATADVVSSSNKGLGKLLKALFGKWIAKNERAVALIQAQTEKDCTDVRNGIKVYREGQLLDCPAPVLRHDPDAVCLDEREWIRFRKPSGL